MATTEKKGGGGSWQSKLEKEGFAVLSGVLTKSEVDTARWAVVVAINILRIQWKFSALSKISSAITSGSWSGNGWRVLGQDWKGRKQTHGWMLLGQVLQILHNFFSIRFENISERWPGNRNSDNMWGTSFSCCLVSQVMQNRSWIHVVSVFSENVFIYFLF